MISAGLRRVIVEPEPAGFVDANGLEPVMAARGAHDRDIELIRPAPRPRVRNVLNISDAVQRFRVGD